MFFRCFCQLRVRTIRKKQIASDKLSGCDHIFLLDCQTLTDAQFDTLLKKKIPLAFVTSGEINGKLQALITRIPKQNLPVVLINETGNTLTGSKSDFIALSGNELNNLELNKK